MNEIIGAGVTVVVPCFNSERTLRKCIDSLLSQTMQVQIVIVNDGSKDGTLEIANDYALENDNIKVISHDNRGLPQSRKAGLEKVQTKYVAFVDSDDWVESEMFETLFKLSEKNSAEISVCGLFYDTEKGRTSAKQNVKSECVDGIQALSILHSRTGIYPYMWNKLFLTKFIADCEFPTGNFLGEDYATIVPCFLKADCVAVTGKPLYHYVLKEGSMSKSGYGPSYRKAFDNYKQLYEKYKNEENVCGVRNEMAVYLCLELSAIYVAMVRNSNYDKDAIEYIREFLKKYLLLFLKGKDDLYFKVSVILIAMAPRLFRCIYSLVKAIV